MHLRNTEQFFCPQCQELVQLKIGQVMIPHFAHLQKSRCRNSFSEGETADHLLGKHLLYEMFQKLRLNVHLEPYLPQLGQRPDIFVEFSQQQFAIEFQCSTIPIPQIENRTAGYKQANISPIWILKTPDNGKSYTSGIQLIKLSPFKQKFITYIQQHRHMITFDPESASFVYFSYLMPIGGYRFIANIQHLPVDVQHFPFLSVKEPSKDEFLIYWYLWKKARQQFLKRRLLISKKGVQDAFLYACYLKNYQLENLPLFIGIPVLKTTGFSVFEAEWQMLWLTFLEEKGYNFHIIASDIIHEFTKKYPLLVLNKQAIKSLNNYTEILKKLDITKINSVYDEEMLYQYIYVQFLAKR